MRLWRDEFNLVYEQCDKGPIASPELDLVCADTSSRVALNSVSPSLLSRNSGSVRFLSVVASSLGR